MAPKSKAQRRREWEGELAIMIQEYRDLNRISEESAEKGKQIDAHIRRGLRMAGKGEI